MKSLLRGVKAALFAFTAILCGNAFGATPVAVWDGDLADGSVQGDYTMSARTDDASVVSFANGKAVTTATNNKTSQGVIISCPAASGTQNTTIFFKYSSYSAQNGNHAFFSANWESADKDVVIYGNGAKNRMGIAYGTTSSEVGNQNTNSSNITIPTAGIMMVSMSIESGDALGTQVAIAPLNENGMYGDFVQLHRRDNVRWTGSKVTMMRLGGTIASTSHYYRPSLTIEGVKIFNTGITVAEANEMELFNPVEVFDGSLPTADEAARFRESTWKGTVWLKNITSRNNGDGSHFMDPDTYGNANSIVRLTGFNGYLVKDNEIETTVELVDDGATLAYNQTDGTTTGPVIFKKVIGSGTLTSKASGGAAQKIVIKDATGFTGSVTMQGGRGLTIGDTSFAANNQIVIASGKTATLTSGKTWTDAGGIKVDGTLTKEYGATASGTLSGSGEVVALGDSTAERALNQIGLSGLTAGAWTGTLTIKNWRGQTDAGNAKFGNLYGNSASTIRFDGYDGYAFMQTYSAVKAYDIAEGGLTIRGGYTDGNAGFVGALTGSGPITLYANGSQNATAGNVKFIGDVSGYTGTISFDNATTFRVAFLAATNSEVPAYSGKEVLIGAGVTAPAFTTTGAIHAMNGAILNPSVAVPAAGSAIIDNGAVVQLSEMPEYEVGTKIIALENAISMALPVQATIKIGEQEQTFYGLAQKTDGVYVVEQEELTWKGESGSAITAEGAWQANFGGYAENAEYGKFVLPAGKEGCVIKVPEGTANVGLMMVKGGSYIFEGEGQAWQIGALLVSEGAAVTFKNIDIDILSSDVADPTTLVGEDAHISFPSLLYSLASGEVLTVDRNITLKLAVTPSFNGNSTIKIADAASLKPGTYCLIKWAEMTRFISGYGLPKLNIEGYEGGLEVCLVPEADKLWLQVISAEQAARKPLVIMPWGDSITEGTNGRGTGANYRIQLCQKLSLAGYNVKTVGYWTSNPKTPAGTEATNKDWWSHSGRGSERLGAQQTGCGSFYDSWANALDQAGDPDVVLMHCGINDMLNNSRNIDADEAFTYFTNIVYKVLNARPNLTLVMTTPMCCEYGHSEQQALYDGDPNHRDTNKAFVKPFHDKAVEFFAKVQSEEGLEGFDKNRLFFADMYEAVMPRWYANQPETFLNIVTAGGGDHCHPDWNGHSIMAETWLKEIKAAFPQDKDGNYDCRLAEIETPAAVDAETLGAEAKEELADFRKGFKKVRVLNPTGKEKFTKGEAPAYDWSDEEVADDAEIEKVGYFVEYVFPSATTNIHRWVWVDMDAFGDKTVAAVGLPTIKKTQQAVASLHVFGNHPAVYNTAADAEGIEGYLDFGPFAYGTGAARGEGAPARWMNRCWDEAFDETGVYGAMQIHRKFTTNEELGNRGAQCVFAYNGWSREDATLNNDFGIGNFSQHFSGVSLDWTGLGATATANASVLESKTIEIWVKLPKQIAAKIGDTEYETLEDAIKDLKNGATLTLQSDIELDSTLVISTGKYGTIDLNGHAITSTGSGVALDFEAGSQVTVTGAGSITTKSGPAITSAGLTTISGTKGIPVIGGAKVTKGSASKLSVDEAFLPETPLTVDYDWTGTFMNSTMPRLAIAHTSEASYSARAKYNFNPIREVDGVMYAATMSGGAGIGSEHIFMVDYCYTVNEATIEIEHATIPYVFGIETDTLTGKMYTLKAKVMMVMGQPQYTTVTPEDISFQVQVESGYQNPSVVANGETIVANEKGYYHIRPGATGTAITITAEEIKTTPTYDEVTEDTPLADIVPGAASEQIAALEKAGVKATDIAAWAVAKGGASGSATIGGEINLEAFALNCSPDELATAKENFKVSIEIAADGTIKVTAPDGYNIVPVIKGSATVDGKYDLEQSNPDAKFFKAIIGE